VRTFTPEHIHRRLILDAITSINATSGLPTATWCGHSDAQQRANTYAAWCLRTANEMSHGGVPTPIPETLFDLLKHYPTMLREPGPGFIDEWRAHAEDSGIRRNIPGTQLFVGCLLMISGVLLIGHQFTMGMIVLGVVPVLIVIQQVLRWCPAVGPDYRTPPWRCK
jgi:hypothetical protein